MISSKHELSYAFKAVVDIFKNEDYCDTDCKGGFYSDMTIHYYADTLCSLGRLLRKREPDATNVKIYENKKEVEHEVPRSRFSNADGSWLSKSAMCESNKRYTPLERSGEDG